MSPTSGQYVPDGSGAGFDAREEGSGFSEQLSRLEAEGASMLVVGDVDDDVHAAVGRDLLGEADRTRRRVLSFSGPRVGTVEDWLPTGASRDPDRLQVVVNGHTRGAAESVDAGGRSADPEWASVPEESIEWLSDDGVDTLGAAIADAIGRVSDGRELESGELRVGYCSLAPIVGHGGVEAAAKFTHLLGHQVRDAGGRAFFHLPRRIEAKTVRELRPWFDVVVELDDADRPRQRWHVVDGSTSGWFPVERDDAHSET